MTLRNPEKCAVQHAHAPDRTATIVVEARPVAPRGSMDDARSFGLDVIMPPRICSLALGALVAVGCESNAVTAGSSEDEIAAPRPGEELQVGDMELCWCPAGQFLMGSPVTEPGRRADEALVTVTLTKGFWMGKYEVTQGEWRPVMGTPHGELRVGKGDDFPVYWVSYLDAEEFCRRLTEQAQADGGVTPDWEFRLPTEAQWEYACRAGTTSAFSFGDQISQAQANFGRWKKGMNESPDPSAEKVGAYPGNAWGLHDMHGNEFEWCRDWYHQERPGGVDPDLSDVKGTPNRDGTYSRVRRGGAWTDEPWACRSACRIRFEPERSANHIGFRVALVRR
jgi:formylglycine-generating enzyme